MGVTETKPQKYDFAGWATRIGIRCSDGRTICHNAFKDCCGHYVPLVWNHDHGDPGLVLGMAYLEHSDDGVYCYGIFNNTEKGRDAKELVKSKNITNLSIFANHLKERCGEVFHGEIREVSLVLAGANPGAKIETVLCHGDGDDYEEEAKITMPNELSLIEEFSHADNSGEESSDDASTTKKGGTKMAAENEKTVEDVFNEFTEEQKTVVYALVGAAVDKAIKEKEDGGDDMSHNAFDQDYQDNVICHADEQAIIADGKKFGSLKESVLAHSEEYGIDHIDWLFPEARAINGGAPEFIKRQPDDWVSVVMNGVHKSPFARVKMMFADIRGDEARAKGYAQKGKLKKEEVFTLSKRTIEPTTIYKKQKIDRDDKIDITDFEVVGYIKGEMRMMLDEEIARAVIFGDGRSSASEDKVDSSRIIPVVSDNTLFTLRKTVTPAAGQSQYDAIIDASILAQDDYEGSGNLTAFIPTTIVSNMRLLKDADGHRMYKNEEEIALAMGVNRIVKVPGSIVPTGVLAVVLDLKDYNMGADKGGSINMFEDFDIDFNQEKYLIETRCSGGLTKPFSAYVLNADS